MKAAFNTGHGGNEVVAIGDRELHAALDRLESGRQFGKIAIDIDEG